MSTAAATWDCTEAHQFVERPAYADHPACRAHCRACDGCITLKDRYAGCRCGRCAPYCWPCWNGAGTSPRTACARRRLRLEQPAPSPRRARRRSKTTSEGKEAMIIEMDPQVATDTEPLDVRVAQTERPGPSTIV